MRSNRHLLPCADSRTLALRLLWWPLASMVALSACAPGATTTPGGGAPDRAVEARIDSVTQQTRQLQVQFEWSMRDREVNFSGRGVLRLDRSARARVDLFDTRGNTLAMAIAEGDRLRIQPPLAEKMLPPAGMLWAVLGDFRPPPDAALAATTVQGNVVQLDYARDGTTWRFRFENDVLRNVEWVASGERRTVELIGSSRFGMPAEGTFRDHIEFRELTLRATQVEETTGFDADVWILPGER